MFDTKNGVRQGGVLSPILFCVYMDELFILLGLENLVTVVMLAIYHMLYLALQIM